MNRVVRFLSRYRYQISLVLFLMAAGWAGFIYVLSDRPASSFDSFNALVPWLPAASYFVHVGLYFVLGALLYGAIILVRPLSRMSSVGWVLIAVILYGFMDEYHQRFVDGRSFEAVDLIADVTGALIAMVVFELGIALWQRFSRR